MRTTRTNVDADELSKLEQRIAASENQLKRLRADWSARLKGRKSEPAPSVSAEFLAEVRAPLGELVQLIGSASRPVGELVRALRQCDLEELRDGAIAELEHDGSLRSCLAVLNEADAMTDRSLASLVRHFSKHVRR